MLDHHSDRYYVPQVVEDFSTKHVLATEFVNGVELEDIVQHGSQDLKDELGTRILEVAIREIFEYHFMQTDPNPGNFMYDVENDKLILLDFGACREYTDEFIDYYF